MLSTFVNLFKQKDIRNKIFFTLGILFIFRLGAGIPAPSVDTTALLNGLKDNSVLGIMNLLGGGALQRFSIFAMGVTPYITASIIIQLLSMDVVPALTEMAKNGQNGKKQMDRITRYATVFMAFFQSYTMAYAFQVNYGILNNPSVSTYIYISVVLTAGSMFLLWLGDRITQFGIGNGISIIIFAGIVSRIPYTFSSTFSVLVDTSSNSALFAGVMNYLLSTVKNSDMIMVLEHGKIIESGNHNDLIKQQGKYYQLYTGAFIME
jgi:preprotein translocase subunit SecY